AMNPWARAVVDVDGCLLDAQFRVDAVANSRGQNAIVQGEGHLDKRSSAGRGYAMTDHRLDRAEGPLWQCCASRPEYLRQRLHLRRVAQRDSRTVRFDQGNRIRIDCRLRVGPLQRKDLSFLARCEKT